ncbi:TetR/AcrR family transcriptional regulator [Novosphingobium sp. AP12]|uniref:TetR/AcrR family transcriptional regulator n=1 Tax=Novosphingobium sp. AP12 TaxID=1144305 RepID=UPI000271FBBA|nr:TetR/AcrR family transcriptional regulator [Novosphingobium sp. AP12]EJL22707.1 transcriptional regulator [Novosphingobium sp. AP12]
MSAETEEIPKAEGPTRRVRADAQRNLVTLLDAAKHVFAEAGTEAPVRDIAERAGVGVGTVYRHFPTRADLIAAVFAYEIDACADAADRIAAEHPPFAALSLWMGEFVKLASTKRGLAQALHSGDPAYDFMPVKRQQRLFPAFRTLFEAAVTSGEIRGDVSADDFLNAAATLCASAGDRPDQARGLVMLLVDGLRCK